MVVPQPLLVLGGEPLGEARRTGADVAVRPVYPLAIRTPDFFKKVNPLFASYVLRDAKRVADYVGLPFVWPNPDPVDTNAFPAEVDQPHIHRLTRLGVEATLQRRGLAFIDSVSRLIFCGTQNWDQGDHLAKAAAQAGLDLASLDSAISADPRKYDSIIEESQIPQVGCADCEGVDQPSQATTPDPVPVTPLPAIVEG